MSTLIENNLNANFNELNEFITTNEEYKELDSNIKDFINFFLADMKNQNLAKIIYKHALHESRISYMIAINDLSYYIEDSIIVRRYLYRYIILVSWLHYVVNENIIEWGFVVEFLKTQKIYTDPDEYFDIELVHDIIRAMKYNNDKAYDLKMRLDIGKFGRGVRNVCFDSHRIYTMGNLGICRYYKQELEKTNNSELALENTREYIIDNIIKYKDRIRTVAGNFICEQLNSNIDINDRSSIIDIINKYKNINDL